MFKTPFTALIAGGTGTGKTKWLIKFIKNTENLMDNLPKHILYCYSEINDDIMEMKRDGIEIFNGIPDKETIKSKPTNTLVILDDLANEIKPDYLDMIFTRGSHHWHINIVLVTQNLFDKNIKVARINSHYIILMKSPQSLLQIRTLGNHLFPGNLAYFIESYNDAIQKPYGYLVINLHPNTAPEFKLSTNIFPKETILIYLPI